MNEHAHYMNSTLQLALGGVGKTNPNPLVGAVIVKDGTLIAEGFHHALGCAHAEVDAVNHATQSVQGATLYVNLEPCAHFGKTPPCAQAIIDAGIRQVVIGMVDPNPQVAGKGIQALKNAGIDVIVGILEQEAKKLNEIFITYITKKKPFVILKCAMTLDGKIASSSGDAQWISGEIARQHVHTIRDRVSAIMVGVNTVLCDNPMLTTRLPNKEGSDPIRIIVDSHGRTPLESHVIKTPSQAKTIIATTSRIDAEKEAQFVANGVRIIKAGDDRIDLSRLMDELYQREIDSILLEGGGTLNFSALEAGIVDKVMMFIAPKIIGGKTAITPVEGTGFPLMKDALPLHDMTVCTIGDDLLIEGYLHT